MMTVTTLFALASLATVALMIATPIALMIEDVRHERAIKREIREEAASHAAQRADAIAKGDQ